MDNRLTIYDVAIHCVNGEIVEFQIEATGIIDLLDKVSQSHERMITVRNGGQIAKIEWMLAEEEDELFADDENNEPIEYSNDFLDFMWKELREDGNEQ